MFAIYHVELFLQVRLVEKSVWVKRHVTDVRDVGKRVGEGELQASICRCTLSAESTGKAAMSKCSRMPSAINATMP